MTTVSTYTASPPTSSDRTSDPSSLTSFTLPIHPPTTRTSTTTTTDTNTTTTSTRSSLSTHEALSLSLSPSISSSPLTLNLVSLHPFLHFLPKSASSPSFFSSSTSSSSSSSLYSSNANSNSSPSKHASHSVYSNSSPLWNSNLSTIPHASTSTSTSSSSSSFMPATQRARSDPLLYSTSTSNSSSNSLSTLTSSSASPFSKDKPHASSPLNLTSPSIQPSLFKSNTMTPSTSIASSSTHHSTHTLKVSELTPPSMNTSLTPLDTRLGFQPLTSIPSTISASYPPSTSTSHSSSSSSCTQQLLKPCLSRSKPSLKSSLSASNVTPSTSSSFPSTVSNVKTPSQPSVSFTLDLGTIRFFRRNDRPKDIQAYGQSDEPISPLITYTCQSQFELVPTLSSLATIQLVEYQVHPVHPQLFLKVAVKNFTYEKQVFVRCTFNQWQTYTDVPLTYHYSTTLDFFQGTIDFPTFSQDEKEAPSTSSLSRSPSLPSPSEKEKIEPNEFIKRPPSQRVVHVSFCCKVLYQDGREAWDNHFGENYSLDIFKLKNEAPLFQ